MKYHGIWAGEELREQDKADMRRWAQTVPTWDRNVWVYPRDISLNGSKSRDELMAGYQEAADAAGFTVRDMRAEVTELVKALPPEKQQSGQLVLDIWDWEMKNEGQISVKDMGAYLIGGKEGGLTTDFSARPDEGSGQILGTEAEFERDFAVPMINPRESAILYMPVEHRTYSDQADDANDDALVEAPQIDIWAMWAKEGTQGQKIMQAAAASMIDRYVKMAETGVQEGTVDLAQGPDQGRFVPSRVDPQSALGKKANPDDPSWSLLPGELAGHSLYDGLARIDGRPVDQYGVTVMKVPEEKWPLRTWETGMSGPRDRTLPALNITKSHEASWKKNRELANPVAQFAGLGLGPGSTHRSRSATPPPRRASPASSNSSHRRR